MFTINRWATEFTYDDKPLDSVVSEVRPQHSENSGPYFPVVNFRRVTGYKYMPYRTGSEAWRKAANQVLADRARGNFERQSRH